MIKQPNASGAKAGQRDGAVSNEIEQQVSRLLRTFYSMVEQEPIPERFLDLLERLDAAEDEQTAKAGEPL